MRIWCLSSMILETYEDPIIPEYRSGSIDRHFKNGKICCIEDCLKKSQNYVLSEIRIGKRNENFYFVLCRQGTKIFELRMVKDALKILPRKNEESTVIDILTDEERFWNAPKVLGNRVISIRIRSIKSTKERVLSATELELYKEYAERINTYAAENSDKYEEAFQHFGPLILPNQTTEKVLKQKITDLYDAITELCHEGLEDIYPNARYNNQLFDNEVFKFCPGQYDVKYEETKDFYGCRLLFYASINLGAINERWFLADSLQTFSLTNTDVFKTPSSWDIIEKNIGKLQQLKVLEFNFCNISEIPDNVFKALPQSLENLLLQNNSLTKISSSISKLVKLDTLSLLNTRT